MGVDTSRRLGAATPGDGQPGLDGRGRPRNLADDGRFADCVGRLEEVVSELARTGVSGVSERVLVDGAAVLAKAVSRSEAVRGDMLVAIGEQESWRISGVRTFAQWNEKTSGQSPSATMKEVKRVQALGADLQHTSTTLKDDGPFTEHVDIVRRIFSTPVLKGKLNAALEGELIAWARKCVPRQFEQRVKTRAFQKGPAFGVENEKAETRKESMAFTKAGSDMRVTGWLSGRSSTLVDAALSAAIGRKSAGDSRTLPGRRAEALVELIGTKPEGESSAIGMRVRTHLSVHVPLATLVSVEESLGCPIVANDAEKAVSQESRNGPLIGAGRVSESSGGVRWMREHSEAGLGDERDDIGLGCDRVGNPTRYPCPERGGDQGRLGRCLDVVTGQRRDIGKVLGGIPTLSNVDVFSGLEPATPDDGSPLSASQLVRLLYDSTFSRVVLSTSGEVLGVGRN